MRKFIFFLILTTFPIAFAHADEDGFGVNPYNPNQTQVAAATADKALPGGYVTMSGHYRLAAGIDDDFILNDSNADLQEKNFRYVFGERLNNTYDPAIYDQYLLNVDFAPADKVNFYTQLVADPWSWVGTTGEQIQKSDIGNEFIRYNLKYFGAFNSTLNEGYRTNVGDLVGFPIMKVHDGHTGREVLHGFYDFNPATNGIPFTIPELDIDYEFRPVRKLWMDYNEDQWHFRAFALADQEQAMTTDDPLELSNHRDYWQQSPWLYSYTPVQHFTDGSIKRGYYSDTLSFLARDSEGNRLVLLRGLAFEADLDRTYFATTFAAPYSPWDEHYFDYNNIPGAIRLKHQATDRLMIGGTYTFRSGMIDDSIADLSNVGGVDAKFQLNDVTTAKAEIAVSEREKELLTNEFLKNDVQGYAYRGIIDSKFEHRAEGETDLHLSVTQMDENFDPVLSRYTNTRDDHFWGKTLSFIEYSPDLEYFRIGDGIDVNRLSVRLRWREKLFKDRFMNLFDVRNVHKASNYAYKETVIREEMTYKVNSQLTAKGMFRWHGLPETTRNVEPFIANFYVADVVDPVFQNVEIKEDLDADRFTYAGGLQYQINKQWTAEGILQVSNDIPDFPRGLLNGVFRDANDRIDSVLTDHLTNFLYGQGHLGATPPYEYFTVTKERIIYKPEDKVTVTFHAAQNGYKYAGGIDDNINHQGVSVAYDYSEKLSLFVDVSHMNVIDLPKLIATNYVEHDFRDHYNFYASADYRISSHQLFRAEYGVLGLGADTPQVTPYSTTGISFPTIDTEHLLRVSLTGEF